MSKLIALCYFLLSLFGCNVGESTYVHRTSVDGSDVLYSKAQVEAGVARFQCLDSMSGQCHYTVYPRKCARASAGKVSACAAGDVKRFAIARGDSRQIAGLRDFRLCVTADGGAAGPDCEAADAVAAR